MTPQGQFAWDALEFRAPTMLRIAETLPQRAWDWWPPNESNSVSWLVWHIAEVEDNWIRDKLLALPKRFPFGASVRETARENYPGKAELLAYFREVRVSSRERLQAMTSEHFDDLVSDEHFGNITVRQLWCGVATSCAWHAGQIALTNRLIPAELKNAC